MKIQSTTSKTTAHMKKGQTSTASSSFAELMSSQTQEHAPVESTAHKQQSHTEEQPQKEAPLENILHDLEEVILELDSSSKSHKHAQEAICSLKDALRDMPDAFPLSESEKQEAEILLAVESKRIAELIRFDDAA